MAIHTLTYTGDGTKKTLAALAIASGNYSADQASKFRANWIQAVCEGAGTARFGDVNTSASYGIPLPQQAGQMCPPIMHPEDCYSFTGTYIYTPNGTVVTFLWDA
jgi:hypothetical protein